MRPLLAVVLVLSVPLVLAAHGAGEPTGASAAVHTIDMRNFAFAPARLEAAVGDTVVWINRDAAPHTATDSAGRWGSDEVAAGARWVLVLSDTGRIAYRCEYHPTMRGELVVRASTQTPDEREDDG